MRLSGFGAGFADEALHRRVLDELLHAHKLASNAMTRIDEEEPEDIARHRKNARKDD